LYSKKTAKAAEFNYYFLLSYLLQTKAKSKRNDDAIAYTNCVLRGHEVQTVKLKTGTERRN